MEARDLAARAAVIKSLHDVARQCALRVAVHFAARSMTAATSAGWEI
jgi:hypothetical protein